MPKVPQDGAPVAYTHHYRGGPRSTVPPGLSRLAWPGRIQGFRHAHVSVVRVRMRRRAYWGKFLGRRNRPSS
jgi:hypothetical protein